MKPDESAKSEDKPAPKVEVPKAPEKPASQYGFIPGKKLWAKNSVVNVYSYPESSEKNRVGYITKQAESQTIFISDSSVNGFIKANAVYFKKTDRQKTIGNVFILAKDLTNVAP